MCDHHWKIPTAGADKYYDIILVIYNLSVVYSWVVVYI